MNDEPITLRRASPADAADFARLMADPEVFGALMQLPWPSEAMWRERLSAGAKEEFATSGGGDFVARVCHLLSDKLVRVSRQVRRGNRR